MASLVPRLRACPLRLGFNLPVVRPSFALSFASRGQPDWMDAESDLEAMKATTEHSLVDMFDSGVEADERTRLRLSDLVDKHLKHSGPVADEQLLTSMKADLMDWHKEQRRDYVREGVQRMRSSRPSAQRPLQEQRKAGHPPSAAPASEQDSRKA